jgi:hypothetical protein
MSDKPTWSESASDWLVQRKPTFCLNARSVVVKFDRRESLTFRIDKGFLPTAHLAITANHDSFNDAKSRQGRHLLDRRSHHVNPCACGSVLFVFPLDVVDRVVPDRTWLIVLCRLPTAETVGYSLSSLLGLNTGAEKKGTQLVGQREDACATRLCSGDKRPLRVFSDILQDCY